MKHGFHNEVQEVSELLTDAAALIGKPHASPTTLFSGVELKPGLGLEKQAETLSELAEDIKSDVFRLAVVGDFKNGKSSLLNAIFKEEVLPTGNLPMTPTITVVKYGQSQQVAIHSGLNPLTKKVEHWSLNDFQEQFRISKQGAKNQFSEVSHVVVERPVEWLSGGVQIIDTPGLRENQERTKLTLDYIKRAHAIIFVLDATQFMSLSENKLVSQLYSSGTVSRVFFVINKMDTILDDERAEFTDFVSARLRPYFNNKANHFDKALYEKRVFYLSAKQELDSMREEKEQENIHSGVKGFFDELNTFLTNNYRLKVIEEIAQEKLGSAISQARYHIKYRKDTINRPLSILEQRKEKSETQLKEMDQSIDGLQEQVYASIRILREKIFNSLNAYLNEMEQNWPEDSKNILQLDGFAQLAILKASDIEKLNRIISEKTQEYLQQKFKIWFDSMPPLLMPHLEKILRSVLFTARDLQIMLEDNALLFTGQKNQGEIAFLVQRIINHLSLDNGKSWASTITGSFSNSNNYLENSAISVIQSIVKKFPAFAGAVALVIGTVDTIEIYENWGKTLFKNLRKEIHSERAIIYHQIEQNMVTAVNPIFPIFYEKIDEVRSTQQQLIAQISDEKFDINQEEGRLEIINSTLMDCFRRLKKGQYSDEELEDIISFYEEGNRDLTEQLRLQPPSVQDPRHNLEDTLNRKKRMLDLVQLEEGVLHADSWMKSILGVSSTSLNRNQTPEDILNEIDEYIGLGDVKGHIRRLVAEFEYEKDYPLASSSPPLRNMVFTGNPGTGKTTIARKLGKILQLLGFLKEGHVVDVSRSDLVAEYVGQTATRTKAKIIEALDGVLFIDEAYALTRSESNIDYGREAIDEIVKAITDYSGRLVIIVAGYPAEMQRFIESNPGLRSRFPININFPDYTTEELTRIALQILQKRGLIIPEDVRQQLPHDIERLRRTNESGFGNVREVENYIQKVSARLAYRVSQLPEGSERDRIARQVTLEDLPNKAELRGKRKGQIDEKINKLDALIGLQSVKQRIQRMMRLLEYDELYGKPNEERASLHMAFVGNPGTGKTMVAHIVGEILRELGILKSGHFVEAGRSDLVGSFVGQTADKTRAVIQRALDGVLFIDEAYSLSRSESDSDFGYEAIDEIVRAMYEYRDRLVIIVAGYPDQIDELMNTNPGLRGRFSEIIRFQDYSIGELMEILHLKSVARGYTISPEVEERAAAYLKAARRNNRYQFSNGRAAENLLNKMRERLASRILDIESDEEREQKAFTFEVEDVPRYKSSFKSGDLIIIIDSATEPLTIYDLLPHPAADRLW